MPDLRPAASTLAPTPAAGQLRPKGWAEAGGRLGAVRRMRARGSAWCSGARERPPARPPPHLDLALGHAQGVGEARALRARQVLGLLEGLLQREDLLAREGRPRVLLLAVLVQDPAGLGCTGERVSAAAAPSPAPPAPSCARHSPGPARRGSLQGEP